MTLDFLFGSTGRASDCESEGPGFNPSIGLLNFLTALCLLTYKFHMKSLKLIKDLLKYS